MNINKEYNIFNKSVYAEKNDVKLSAVFCIASIRKDNNTFEGELLIYFFNKSKKLKLRNKTIRSNSRLNNVLNQIRKYQIDSTDVYPYSLF